MNTVENNAGIAQNQSYQDDGKRFIYPNSLNLYHASTNVATGVAAEIALHPARRWTNGCFFLTLVPQKDELQIRQSSGGRKTASFDWNGRKISVKLDFSDVCSLLTVLRGETSDINEGHGLLHDSKDATTVIYFGQSKDRPGCFSLCLSKKPKTGGDPLRLRIGLSAAEALGIRLLFEQSLFTMIYGFPVEGTVNTQRQQAQEQALADVPVADFGTEEEPF